MLSYLIVSGLCLLLLLHIVCKVWQHAIEIHCAADNFDEACDLAAQEQQATNTASATPEDRLAGTVAPKYCHVW